jgi:hypothetical protein
VGVAQFDSGQVLRGNTDDGDVTLRIDADNLGKVLAAVRQTHSDFARTTHDVRVSQDRAVRADDESGTFAVHRLLGLRLYWETAEELAERVLAARTKWVLSLRSGLRT